MSDMQADKRTRGRRTVLPKASRASNATTTSLPASTQPASVPSSRATLLDAAGVPTCHRTTESPTSTVAHTLLNICDRIELWDHRVLMAARYALSAIRAVT